MFIYSKILLFKNYYPIFQIRSIYNSWVIYGSIRFTTIREGMFLKKISAELRIENME